MNEICTARSETVSIGAVGLALTTLFCVWIAASPGGLYSVFLGGALGFAGFVISVIGIATGSGRATGALGWLVFVFGWVLNEVVLRPY